MLEQPRSSWCGLEWPQNLDLSFTDDVGNLLDWVSAPVSAPEMQQQAVPYLYTSPASGGPTAAAFPDLCNTALGLQWDPLAPELAQSAAQSSRYQASAGCWSLNHHDAATEPTTGMPGLPCWSQHSAPQSQTRSGFTSVVLAAAGRYLPQHEIAAAVAHQQHAQAPAGQVHTCWPGVDAGSSTCQQQQQQVSTGPTSWISESMGCAGMSGAGMGCAGMDTETPSTPAGQTALPSSCLQAEGRRCAGMGCAGMDSDDPSAPAGWTALPGSCCPLGAACAGVYCLACFEAEMRGAKAAGGGSSTGSNGSATPCILQAPAGSAGQQGARSPFLSLGSAGSASTSPAAGAGNAAGVLTAAARRESGPFGAGAGACSSPAHVTMPRAQMHSTEAGGTGPFADTARQLLAVSQAAAAAAAAAASDPFSPAAHASAGGQSVPCAPQANAAAAAAEIQQGTNRSGSERVGKLLSAPAQLQSPTASLGRTANKVIVKDPRRKSIGKMQHKAQPAHPPAAPKGFAEGGSTAALEAMNSRRLESALHSMQDSRAQLKARLNKLHAEVDGMAASNSQLRAANSELKKQVQAVTVRAQQRGLLPVSPSGAQV